MYLLAAFALVLGAGASHGPSPPKPVLVGLDLEFGHLTSTSDDAVKQGALAAIDEINGAGGVLGGRRLAIVERDNRSVPARGVENLRELAAMPDVIAVVSGKFSPVVLAELPHLAALGLPLLDPWAAADGIVSDAPSPRWVFRLSLRDGWAIPAMLAEAQRRGAQRVGVLVPRSAWGRSCEAAARTATRRARMPGIADVQWYSWGEPSLLGQYRALREAGSEAVLLVANEGEGATLVRELAALPRAERLPIVSHWGITGGDFPALAGAALGEVDLTVVQTFSFHRSPGPRAATALATARRLFGHEHPEQIPSVVGFAHAYDLVHILSRALALAGSADRSAVRSALERVRGYDGLVRRYARPFTPERHEALDPSQLFMARWDGRGILLPVGGDR